MIGSATEVMLLPYSEEMLARGAREKWFIFPILWDLLILTAVLAHHTLHPASGRHLRWVTGRIRRAIRRSPARPSPQGPAVRRKPVGSGGVTCQNPTR